MTPGAPLFLVERAEAVIIGAELLSGKIRDENTQALARMLWERGIRLARTVTIPDDVATIADAVSGARSRTGLVFTSGGVGPTHDDVTLEGVAAALGLPLEEDPRLVEHLRAAHAGPLTPAHLRMALVPRGSHLHVGPASRWPVLECQGVFVLPGVPEYFRRKLDVIRDLVQGPAELHCVQVLTTLAEADFKDRLDQVVEAFPQLLLGSYPEWKEQGYLCRLTVEGTSRAQVEAAAGMLRQLLGPGPASSSPAPSSQPEGEGGSPSSSGAG